MENGVKIIDRKGGKVLLYGGYQFYRKKNYVNKTVLWKCKEKKIKCKGSITVTEQMVVQAERPHTCIKIPLQNDIALALNDVRHAAEKTDTPIPQLYEDAENKWQEKWFDLIAPLPKFENAKHTFYDARNNFSKVNKINFKSFDEVQVPIALIDNVTEIFADGTFQSCPSPFVQLFIIHAELGSTNTTTKVKPIIFALLSDKKTETYVILFRLLKSQLPNWKPRKYHCDFELAALKAVLVVYPDTTVVGCYYHWSQAMWRNAKRIFGFKKTKPAKRLVGLCSVLPLLPKDNLQGGWEYIKSQFPCAENKNLKRFLNYVEEQWFAKDTWKVMSVFAERHRTNNVAESLHGKLNKIINKSNSNMLRLLNLLTKLTSIDYKKRFRSRLKSLIENDDYIRQIQMELVTGEISVGVALEKLR
ncbi:hypothetical protein ABMA28_010738 [Loxostege sticticalis]|uniref:MULE transposase domain-containing protein n=1 Tax=Loxostege sticticalis TaxID=481309 RepID=A0ABD0S984_LOXSC